MAISASFNQPFNEMLAAFRLRLGKLVPTQRWDDLNQAQHARAFAVAGAQQAQLLADLAASVDTAIAQGKSLDWFAKNFDALVARNGWSPKGGNDWRARVIYDTNISTSYAAGRLSQLQAGDYPLWIYKHSHLAREPRPEHLALDGIVKPAGDPFWQSRYPPRGFGCKCRVVGVRDTQTARNLGGQPDKPLPEWIDQINPKTGLPPGVDKGWGAGLGNELAATITALARQTQQWEYVLAKAYMASVPVVVADQLAVAYRNLPGVAAEASAYASKVLARAENLQEQITLGLLTSTDVAKIKELIGVDLIGYDFSVSRSTVWHIEGEHGASETGEMLRGQRGITPEDYKKIPSVLNSYDSANDAGRSKSTGLNLIKFRKRIGNEEYVLVFEVSGSKRKTMALKTAYVIAKSTR